MFAKSIAAALVIGFANVAQAGTITDIYSSFYTFGDSLSDDGKFGILPATPPSVGGRFSNGPVWAEIVAAQFDAAGRDTGNLALGGATAGDIATGTPFSNFNAQIDTFFGAISSDSPLPTSVVAPEFEAAAPEPGDNPLVAVWLGANDLFASFLPGDITAAAQAVTDGITRLASSSLGDFDDFLVANIPDLGATPAYTSLLALGGASPGDIAKISGKASAATASFNAQLAANLADLRLDLGIDIIEYDAAALFAETIADPDNNFASVILPCTVSLSSAQNPFVCTPAQADKLLFVDAVHPNRIAHQMIAEAVLTRLAPVPLPAGLPLLVIGLGALGLAVRRRKAA